MLPRPRLFSVTDPMRSDTLAPDFDTLSVDPLPSLIRFRKIKPTVPFPISCRDPTVLSFLGWR